MRTFLRTSAVAAAAGLFLAPAAGAASAAAAPAAARAGSVATVATVGVRSGVTTVTTSPGLPSLLFQKGISLLATTPATATLTGGSRLFGGLHGTGQGPGSVSAPAVSVPALRFVFPVSGGRAGLHPVSGRVSQRGGVLFVRADGDRTVLFSSFVMDFGQRQVTAEVDGDPRVRVALFRLDLSHARVRPAGRTITVTGIGLTVTGAGARAVDTGLGTTALSPGTQVGTATTALRT